MLHRTALMVGVVLVCLQWAHAAEDARERPKPPSGTVPPLQDAITPAQCIGCDQPFDTVTHKQVLEGLANNPYLAQLRKALYQQDIIHQFESKAHFDNCDFDSATTYITSLLDEAGTYVDKAQNAQDTGDLATRDEAAGDAFFAIGQALHAVQDFYAHSNYVEMQAPKAKKLADIEVIAPWQAKGRERIKDLRKYGLYSGYVFWGVPQRCPSGTTSHGDLAKDTASTPSGGKKLPNLQNYTQYKVAVFLAKEASVGLVEDSFKRWPLLKQLNGQYVAFEALVDRRGIDEAR